MNAWVRDQIGLEPWILGFLTQHGINLPACCSAQIFSDSLRFESRKQNTKETKMVLVSKFLPEAR